MTKYSRALQLSLSAAVVLSMGTCVVSAQDQKPKSVAATSMGMAKDTSLITGVVFDQQGEPVPGASVVTNIKTIGTATDVDGKFVLKIPKGVKVTHLTASFLGMQSQTLALPRDGKPVTFVLQQDDNQLDEVVVTGLFNRNASSFTGSAATYDAEQLKLGGNQNVLKSIQNLDPSFITNNYSTNGSNPNAMDDINLRGNASFSGLQGDYQGNPNEPLFILDGFETSAQTIFDLDMNRVKSVTILKDAAAKAIYAQRQPMV